MPITSSRNNSPNIISDNIGELKDALLPGRKRPSTPTESIKKLLKQLQNHSLIVQISVGGSVGFTTSYLIRKFTQTVCLFISCGALVVVIWESVVSVKDRRKWSNKKSSLLSEIASQSEKMADKVEKAINEKSRKRMTFDNIFNFAHANRFFFSGALGGVCASFIVC